MMTRALVLAGLIVGLFGGVTLASVESGAVEDRAREARAAYMQGERSGAYDGLRHQGAER